MCLLGCQFSLSHIYMGLVMEQCKIIILIYCSMFLILQIRNAPFISVYARKSVINVTIITHYSDVIMSLMASQITSLTIVYSAVYSGTDERKHQSSASLAFFRGIHQWLANSPHKGPVMRKMFPFDDVIMKRHMFAEVTFHITSMSDLVATSYTIGLFSNT